MRVSRNNKIKINMGPVITVRRPHHGTFLKYLRVYPSRGPKTVRVIQKKQEPVVADQSRVRANLKLHGLSWESREWLVRKYQNNLCGICQSAIEPSEACVDHDHQCVLRANHKATGYGCSSCVRGGLHRACNVWLSLTEKFPQLQSEHIRTILPAGRSSANNLRGTQFFRSHSFFVGGPIR